MQIYTYRNSIFMVGKMKEIRSALQEYARCYSTVKELLNARLN